MCTGAVLVGLVGVGHCVVTKHVLNKPLHLSQMFI